MTRDQHIAIIRDACIKANPDKNQYTPIPVAIRLADCLLAIEERRQDMTISTNGQFAEVHEKMTRDVIEKWSGVFWNLREDNLESQSDETLEFISSLLKV